MRWSVVVVLASCGRLGFETPPLDDAPVAGDTVTDDAAPDDGASGCPAGYAAVCGSCYRFDPSAVSWQAGEAACEVDGGHLVVLADATEESCVATASGSPARMWIGATDFVTEGVWLAVTGAPQAYLPWAAGEPGGGVGISCAEYRPGGWVDEICNDVNDGPCEHDGIPADPNAF